MNTAQEPNLPDIVLLDLSMPALNGTETTKLLREKYPNISIIILSTHFSNGTILNLIELGAASYLAKNTEPPLVEKVIRRVYEKGFYYTDKIQSILRSNFISKNKIYSQMPDFQLTKREIEVLQLICEQFTNGEIAEKLFISQRTVEGHRNNLLSKLGCKNSIGLVVVALKKNLVALNPKQQWK